MSSHRFLYVLVFVVGVSTLGAEIAAARLLAPFFGASTIVWANTIGVVLVALSIGYWLGGRYGDRHPNRRALCLTVLAGSGMVALIPFVANPFLSIAVDALDEIQAGAFAGSLFAVLALFAVPIAVLGMCSPWAIRLAVTDVAHAGQVAGRLYAISTAGSLVGTMLAALLLIPFAGTQKTFVIFAVALAVVAAAGLGWRFAAAPIALACVLLIPVGLVKATADGRVIYEAESEQQYLRVIEQDDGTRVLELNEGVAIHSIYQPGRYLTDDYWDGGLVTPLAALGKAPQRVAILGNAAGTLARMYGHYFPGVEIDGVEIDAELEEVGRKYFDMNVPGLEVHNEDARPWLERSEGGFDVIFVDAYRQPYVPFYLTTREFFELARDRLAPGGVVVVNVGHPEGNDDLEKALGATMAEAFPTVVRDPIEPTNVLLLGTTVDASGEKLRATANRLGLPREVRNAAAIEAARIGPALPGGAVFTDDRAPVEWLIDRSILGYASGSE